MGKLHFTKKGFKAASVAYFLSLASVGISLLAYFQTSFTFGWYASNTKVETTGLGIKVAEEKDANIVFSAYKYRLVATDKGEAGGYEVTDSDDFTMNEYDQVFTEYNAYNPMILKLQMQGGIYSEGDDIPLKLTHNTSLDTQLLNDDGSVSSDSTSAAKPLSSYLSSTVIVKAIVDNTVYGDANSLYLGVKQKCEESYSGSSMKFVSTLDDGKIETTTENNVTHAVKKETLQNFENLKYASVLDGNGVHSCTVYLYLSYDKYLITSYIDQMGGSEITGAMESKYPLGSDLTEVSVAHPETASEASA